MTIERRFTLYLTFAALGAAATVLMVLARILQWPDFVQGFAAGALLGSLAFLFRRTFRDEYLQSLWNAGVSAAFLAVVVWFVVGPFLTGALEGQLAGIRPAQAATSWSGIIALAGFFIGFHVRRWRGPS